MAIEMTKDDVAQLIGDRFIDTPTLGIAIDMEAQQIRLLCHRKKFPIQPVRIGRLLRWRLSDVQTLVGGSAGAK